VDPTKESEGQRLIRNLSELLQELRVAQTGVQILFAFQLTVAFTERFARASRFERGTLLVNILLAAASAACLIAPAAWHRLLFRHGRRAEIVSSANAFALAGLVLLAAAMTGSVMLVAEVIVGGTWASVVGGFAGALFVLLWFLLPLRIRLMPPRDVREGPPQ
jgi:hypothetical protein